MSLTLLDRFTPIKQTGLRFTPIEQAGLRFTPIEQAGLRFTPIKQAGLPHRNRTGLLHKKAIGGPKVGKCLAGMQMIARLKWQL